jgi:hypothetical protein
LIAAAILGLLLTLSLYFRLFLSAQFAQQSDLQTDPFGEVETGYLILWLLGVLVTGSALVWSTMLALRMQRRGWAIWLIIVTVALVPLTQLLLPGLLILVFALWGPTDVPTPGPTTRVQPPGAIDVRTGPLLRTGSNGLASTSFILSLVPLASALLVYLSDLVLFSWLAAALSANQSPDIGVYVYQQTSSEWGDVVTFWFFVGLGAGIAAFITGILALARANEYPEKQAGRVLAGVGLVISSLTVLAFLCAFGVFAFFADACRNGC